MSRPRRSLPQKSYATPSSDEESVAEMGGSAFDSLSQDSTLSTASNERPSVIEESDSSVAEDLQEPSATSAFFPAVLTISQINQTRAVIVEQAANVVELQAKYELHTKLAAEYKSKIKEAQGALAESNARIAPISRVPPEVLGLVFTIHVRDNQQSPWLLMKITRAWRATSLLTRVLWRGIMLVPAGWSSHWSRRNARDQGGLQVCTNEAQLRNALARAGSLSMDIRITSVPLSDPSDTCPPALVTRYKSELCKLLDCLLSQSNPPRIRSLDISTADSFKLALDAFDGFSFAHMECLTLDSNYPMLIVKMARESTRVHSLTIPTTSLKNLKLVKTFNWQQIAHFTLAHVCGDTNFDISEILAVTNGLISLSFCGDAVTSAESGDNVRLEMPSLKHLSMRHSGTFWPIQCPNLTHLTLQLCHEMEVPPDHSIFLPYLAEFVFITRDSSVGALRAFKIPLLQKLSLMHSDGRAISAKGVKELWPIQSGVPAGKRGASADVEAKSIELSGFPINPKLLARTLKERLALEEFIADDVLIDAEFFSILTPVRVKKGKGSNGNGKGTTKGKKAPGSKRGWDVGCPGLKRLVIDLSFRRGKQDNEAAILKSANSLVAERLKVDAPLERLGIRFGKHDDWKELV